MPASARPVPHARLLPLAGLLVALAACSPGGADARTGGAQAVAPALATCTPAELKTVTPDRLTLSTGSTTQAPWVVGVADTAARGGDPNAGRGYDAAVGFSLAERLGFARTEVTWVGTPFPQAISAGDKAFDVFVGQATITEARRADVDLSGPYYEVRQAVVSLTGRPAAGVRELKGLRDLRLAVVKGSPGERAVDEVVRPSLAPTRHDDLDRARGALSAGEQDALVIDVQTALSLDRDETRLVGGELIGQLPRSPEPAESFGLVLEKASTLTGCVEQALAAMRGDGTLDRLEREWLLDGPGFPEFT